MTRCEGPDQSRCPSLYVRLCSPGDRCWCTGRLCHCTWQEREENAREALAKAPGSIARCVVSVDAV